MLKNIIGSWGSELGDGDYACALAALGVLEATGVEQHHPSSDPAELVAALQEEFRLGERTVVWRNAQNVNQATTAASWSETAHTDAAALAAAWREYRSGIAHPRQMPRLALAADWRSRTDLFDFDALCAWLKHRDVGLQALILADGSPSAVGARWHWPLRVGVPAGKEGAGILATLRKAQQSETWVAELSQCFTVGDARDACDLLILTSAAASAILKQPRSEYGPVSLSASKNHRLTLGNSPSVTSRCAPASAPLAWVGWMAPTARFSFPTGSPRCCVKSRTTCRSTPPCGARANGASASTSSCSGAPCRSTRAASCRSRSGRIASSPRSKPCRCCEQVTQTRSLGFGDDADPTFGGPAGER